MSGEIQKSLNHTKHALAGDNDLLRLLFHGKRTNQSSNFFGSLPFGELAETFLTSPYTRVNDLKEQLSGTWVEDEDGTI